MLRVSGWSLPSSASNARARLGAEHGEHDPLQRDRLVGRATSTMIRAHSPSGNPPTPVPKAGSASDRAPSSSARREAALGRAPHEARVRAQVLAHHRAVDHPARGEPPGAGRDRGADRDRPLAPSPRARSPRRPPASARPATPAPIHSALFAAFATASTSTRGDVAVDDLEPQGRKNCRHAVHQSSAREAILRPSSRSTPGLRAYSSQASVRVNSTTISHGEPGSYGAHRAEVGERRAARRPRSARAPAAAATCRALKRPSPAFTSTVVSPGPSSSRASPHDGAVAGDEQHRAAPRAAQRGVDPGLADERRR